MTRGPDMRQLALNRCTDAIMQALDMEGQLERALTELHEAQLHCERQDVVPPGARFGRAMHAAWQVQRGEAFWDRQPADPVPAR